MNRKIVTILSAGLMLGCLAAGQIPADKKPPAPAVQPANALADALAQRLGQDLQVKTAVGEPIKIGSVTLIPILRIDIGFGGGGLTMPGSPSAAAAQNPPAGIDGFFMSGEARPLGFVAVTKKGTRFISLGGKPAK